MQLGGGNGILAIWHDVAEEAYHDFIQWHTREHMPERIAVPGFLRANRYFASQGEPKCFNFYQTESPAVLQSDAYLERLNAPTEWTTKVLPHFQNVNRSAGDVIASVGDGEGGALATVRLEHAGEFSVATDASAWAERLQTLPGIVAAHVWRAESSMSLLETKEKGTRQGGTAFSPTTVVVEGNDEAYVAFAVQHLLTDSAFAPIADLNPVVGVYHLQFRLGKLA